MYERRRMWANAYLQDKFCAGFRTTSRCEGVNAFVKKFSKTTHTILELVQNLELVVREYRNKELLLHLNSMNSVPVMTTGLTSIEQHAASVYTREVFTDVKKQIVQTVALILISKKRCLNTMVYTVEEYEQPATRIKVAYGRSTGKIHYQCNFWRKNGYPCRHMFFVMKSEHVTTIPDALVLQRWRLNVKSIESYVERWAGTSEAGFLLRHGALHTASHRLFLIGAQKLSLFRKALNGVLTLCRELELEYRAFDNGGGKGR
ncbi:protein FAR1-RELATED SEQUENCE 9-like [Arachis hypogaea]|uniref:Protein FAR1-RELATED SEQUENCE n=1 Tax=Arachis hypogaea TaxID=3818 RepID=A0A445A5N6_ARAHY|nr:hypothetical protein Ahy_B03g066980 [Arachis hypogaea]